MTSFKISDGNPARDLPSAAVTDAVMRATGILALMGIAAIHFVQLIPTFRSTPLLGVAFVGLIVGAAAVGVRLASSNQSRTRLWLPVVGVGLAAIGGYVFTRVVSTPLDNQDVGNWSCMLGMAALFVEGTLVGLSAYAMSASPEPHPATSADTDGAAAEQASSLVRAGSTNGSRG